MTYELTWVVGGTLTFETLTSFHTAMVRAGHLAVSSLHDVTVRKLERHAVIWSIEVRPSEVV